MQNYYLIDNIKDNFNIEPSVLQSIKYELDKHIYYYGDQFKYPKERRVKITNIFTKDKLLNILQQAIAIYYSILKPNNTNGNKNILSSAYFTTNIELAKLNYNVYRLPWSINRDLKVLITFEMLREINYFKKSFEKRSFADLIGKEFIDKINQFKSSLKIYYLHNNIAALFVPNDQAFFENISINVFTQINRPSFMFSHGVAERYNNIDENRSDYLIVWGDKIKEHYVRAGINRDKIFVSGHPLYKEFKHVELKSSLNSPLIITKSMIGSQYNDEVRLVDRGNLILYLYMVQSVLRRFGVKRARFRPHPSENAQWYLKFIDNDFYKPDYESLQRSFQKSTIVIGPTSTVFLEALYYGINYICFEPCCNDFGITNFKPVPPFDGTDERLPVAKNEEQLGQIIREKAKVDLTIFNDYIKTPFDLSFIKSII